jgi:rhamnosyltransferase
MIEEKSKRRTAACVILYNPPENFLDNLHTYIHFVEKIFIVNNSSTTNPLVKLAINQLAQSYNIEFWQNRENLGLSIPLNQVFSAAEEQGFSLVLTMDQDSAFTNDSLLQDAHHIFEADEKVGLIGMAHYTTRMKSWYKTSKNFIKTSETLTSGSLVRVSAWKKVKGFDERLFIDNIDNDFCMSLKKDGFLVLQSKGKVIEHDLGETQTRPHRFSKKQTIVSLHSPFRSYYITRNSLLFISKFFASSPFHCLRKMKHYFLFVKKHYLYSPDFRQHKIFIVQGMKDFLKKSFGKYPHAEN